MADEIQNEPLTPAVAPAAVPDIVTTREGGDTATSSSALPIPEESAAVAHAEGAGLAAAEEQRKAGELQTQLTGQEADQADQLAEAKTGEANQANEDLEKFKQDLQKAQAEKAKADLALGGTNPQFHNLLQNETGTKRMLTGIGLLFTGLSGNVEAQKAQFNEINNQIQNDLAVQRENYAAKLKYSQTRGDNVKDLYANYEKYQAFNATVEQKAYEALAAKILAEAKRNGIPLQQAQNSVAYQQAIAQVEKAKAASFAGFHRVAQVTRQLTPTVTDVAGKVQGGGKATAPVAQVNSDDIKFLQDHPPTERARDAARRMLTNDPGIFDKIKGVFTGGSLPDYLSRLTPDERAQAEAIARVTPPLAEVSTNNKRAGTNKEMLAATIESHIPSEKDTAESRARKLGNLSKATGNVGAFQQGVTPSAPKEPMVTIRNKKTGETKQVPRSEAVKLGAVK